MCEIMTLINNIGIQIHHVYKIRNHCKVHNGRHYFTHISRVPNEAKYSVLHFYKQYIDKIYFEAVSDR